MRDRREELGVLEAPMTPNFPDIDNTPKPQTSRRLIALLIYGKMHSLQVVIAQYEFPKPHIPRNCEEEKQ